MKFRFMLLVVLLALTPTGPSVAHEGHRENLSDAEMANMPSSVEDEGQQDVQVNSPASGDASSSTPVTAENQAFEAAHERNRATSLGDFLGRLHPAAVHFPLALLLMAGLAELLLLARPAIGLQPTVRFLVGTGAMGAVIAALLGWFAGGWRLGDRSETLGLHRWNGTGIALVSLLAWWLVCRSQTNRTALRMTLALLAIALLAQGFLGGEMVFGPNHLGIQ